VTAVTELMGIQTQEIQKLEEKLAPRAEVTKLRDIIKNFIEEVNVKLKPFITAEYVDSRLAAAVNKLEAQIHNQG